MGLKQRHVVLLIYAVTAMAAGLGMFMMVARDLGALVVFVCLLLLLFLVFRIVGSVRLSETLAAIRRNWGVHEEAKKQRQYFEVGQLRCREARTFDEWWKALCAVAGQLEFASVALSVEASESGDASDGSEDGDSAEGSEDGASGNGGERNGGGASVYETLIWRNPALTPTPEQMIHVTMPPRLLAPGLHGRLELDIWANGSLESAGRRVALVSRLLDEHVPSAMQGQTHGWPVERSGLLHDANV